MSPAERQNRLEMLLQHAAWIRGLARELVRDPELAEEIEQRTMVAAMARAPRQGVPFTAWLGAIVRNFVRQHHRSEGRRAEREERAARPEALPSTSDVVERAAVQRELVEAVMDLAEPYRTTLLLRYYEGLAPRAVAERMGVPIDTVRTRHARALARLRERLDKGHGGTRAEWLGALLPLAELGQGVAPLATAPGGAGGSGMSAQSSGAQVGAAPAGGASTAGAASKAGGAAKAVGAAKSGVGGAAIGAGIGLMDMKWKVAAALVVVLGVVVFVLTRSDDEAAAGGAAEETAAKLQRPGSGASASAASTPDSDSVRTPSARSSAAHEAAPAAPVILVHGKVLDWLGQGLGGIRVGLQSGGERAPAMSAAEPAAPKEPDANRVLATSAPDGSFAVQASAAGGRFVALEPEWTTVFAGHHAGGPTKLEPVLVLARPRGLTATVVDELGTPVRGARVHVRLAEAFRTRFREVLDASTAVVREAKGDENGRFELDALPDLADVQVGVHHDAYLPFAARLVDLAHETVITLTRPDAAASGVLRGKVVDPAGTPVPEARVAFGIDTSSTDADGLFSFRLEDPKGLNARFDMPARAISALKAGYQLTRFTPPLADGKPVWPAFVTLQLGAPPLELSGRVYGADGKPLAGARVWIMDATFFGGDDRGALHVENLLASGAPRGWRRVETDEEGRFALDGLVDREYHVEALDPTTLLRVQEGPFRAGSTDVELRMPKDALHPRVAGRVVSHSGKPVAGVRVFPMCDGFRTRANGRIIGTSHDALDGVTTDAEGRFELTNVPKELVYVRIQGEDILPLEYCRDGEGDDRFVSDKVSRLPKETIEHLEIVVDLRCHVQITLSDPTSADEVSILDKKGEAIPMNVYDGNSRETRPRFPIHSGRSAAFAVSDAGVTVVLYKDGKEVQRLPIVLERGPLKEVRF